MRDASKVKEFLRERRRSLGIGLGIFLVLLVLKFGFPGVYGGSRFAGPGDLWLVFGLPAALLWEWRDYTRNRKDQEFNGRSE